RQRNKRKATTAEKNSAHAEHRIFPAAAGYGFDERILQTTVSGRQAWPCLGSQSCDCLPPATLLGSRARPAVPPRQRWTGLLRPRKDSGYGESKLSLEFNRAGLLGQKLPLREGGRVCGLRSQPVLENQH